MTIQKINEKYPVNLLRAIRTDLVDDAQDIIEKVRYVLGLNGIHNIREFESPERYEEALELEPEIIPHIALFDYRFPGHPLTGVDLTIMLMKRARNLLVKPKAIMISGFKDPDAIMDFYDAGGFRWVDKNRKDFQQILIDRLQFAIEEIKDGLEFRAFMDELKEV